MPSTELYHTAELVTVLPATRPLDISNPGSIAVMMVSPEGVVRYWPCPVQDTNCVELNLDLSGHPSRSLTAFQVCKIVVFEGRTEKKKRKEGRKK